MLERRVFPDFQFYLSYQASPSSRKSVIFHVLTHNLTESIQGNKVTYFYHLTAKKLFTWCFPLFCQQALLWKILGKESVFSKQAHLKKADQYTENYSGRGSYTRFL